MRGSAAHVEREREMRRRKITQIVNEINETTAPDSIKNKSFVCYN